MGRMGAEDPPGIPDRGPWVTAGTLESFDT
jgi:hypothetical protein